MKSYGIQDFQIYRKYFMLFSFSHMCSNLSSKVCENFHKTFFLRIYAMTEKGDTVRRDLTTKGDIKFTDDR